MSCEYCKDDSFALIYDVDDGDCYIELFNDDGRICLQRSYENKTKSEHLPFNYCPICGKKLKDGKIKIPVIDPERIMIGFVRAHYDRNEEDFKHYLMQLVEFFQQEDKPRLIEYCLAQARMIPTFETID